MLRRRLFSSMKRYVSPERTSPHLKEVSRILGRAGPSAFFRPTISGPNTETTATAFVRPHPNPGRLLIRNFAILRTFAISHDFYHMEPRAGRSMVKGSRSRGSAQNIRLLTYYHFRRFEVKPSYRPWIRRYRKCSSADGNPPAREKTHPPKPGSTSSPASRRRRFTRRTFPGVADRATAGAPKEVEERMSLASFSCGLARTVET